MDTCAFVVSGGSSFSASRSGIASSRCFCAVAVTTPRASERNGRVSRSPRRARAVSMGLIPFVPDWIALGAWFYGAYRFYLGYNETSYQKVQLTCHPNARPSHLQLAVSVCGRSARSVALLRRRLRTIPNSFCSFFCCGSWSNFLRTIVFHCPLHGPSSWL
jgi:hypothetical protein